MTFAILLGGISMLFLALTARLLERRSSRELQERVRAAATLATTAQEDAQAATPRLRALEAERPGLAARVAMLAGFDPNMTPDKTMPWPVVLLLGLLLGAASYWRLQGMAGTPGAALIGSGIALMTWRVIFNWQLARYRRALFEQIPDSMALVVRAVRVGLPLTEAMQTIAREMPEPSKTEFARCMGDVAVGRTMEQALQRMRDRTGVPEYGFLSVTVGLQSQSGGGLAEPLENLADLVRKRVAMAKKVQALTAEARFSAVVVAVLPFLNVAMMTMMRPGYFTFFIEDPRGISMSVAGISLMAIGLYVIRVLVRRTAAA